MADFNIEVGDRGGFATVTVGGQVDLETAPQLRACLLDLATEGKVRILVDLTGTDFLDSTGLGALVAGLKRVRLRDGEIRLVIVSRSVRKVFEITSLDRVFPIFEDLDGALADG
jgi:anti-sigma B factor antagonist